MGPEICFSPFHNGERWHCLLLLGILSLTFLPLACVLSEGWMCMTVKHHLRPVRLRRWDDEGRALGLHLFLFSLFPSLPLLPPLSLSLSLSLSEPPTVQSIHIKHRWHLTRSDQALWMARGEQVFIILLFLRLCGLAVISQSINMSVAKMVEASWLRTAAISNEIL